MLRIFLKAVNPLALVLLAVLGVALQTSLFEPAPLNYLQPDCILWIVIWCALHRSFTEGGLLVLVLGNIAEIHSSAPQGTLMLAYMALYLGVRFASRLIVLPNRTSMVLLTMAAVVLTRGFTLLLLWGLDVASNQWKHTLIFLSPGVIVNGLMAGYVYQWLERFDWVTFKNARAEQMLEDEYLLETEET